MMEASRPHGEAKAAAGWVLLQEALGLSRGSPALVDTSRPRAEVVSHGSSSKEAPYAAEPSSLWRIAPPARGGQATGGGGSPPHARQWKAPHRAASEDRSRIVFDEAAWLASQKAAGGFHGRQALGRGAVPALSLSFNAHVAVAFAGKALTELPSELLQRVMDFMPTFQGRAHMRRACRLTTCLDEHLAPPLALEEELSSFGLGDKGARAVAQALVVPPNNSLGELCLGDNNIGDAGVEAIAHALTSGAKLRRLSLRNNNIGDAGARALAEALNSQTMVEEIDLWGNRFTDVGKQVLLSMAGCEVFLELDVSYMGNRQTVMSPRMRTILFDWTSQVLTGINVPVSLDAVLDPQDLLFRTFGYLDAYLSRRYVKRTELQLTSVACMLAAAGLDTSSAGPEDGEELATWLNFVTEGACTASSVGTAIQDVYRVLGYTMHQPSVYTFLRRYLRRTGWTEESFSLANYFIEIAAIDAMFLAYRPQVVAAAAAVLSRQYLSQGINIRPIPGWKAKLLRCAHVDLQQELAPCSAALAHLHASMHGKINLFVNEKYGWARLHMVAKIPPNLPASATFFVKYLSNQTM